MRRFSSLSVVIGMILLAGTAPPAALSQQLQTVPWTYVSPQGDTVAGRIGFTLNIDTVAARQVVKTLPGTVDTLYCPLTPGACSRTRPTVAADTVRPPAVRGIPVGWTQFPPEQLGGRYNATILSGAKPYAGLAAARARKAEVVLYNSVKLTRAWDPVLKDSVLSVAAGKAFLATFPADICSYFADGTAWGVIVSDDITSTEIWGPGAPYHARIDSLALLWKQKCPGVRTIVRAMPTQLKGYRYKWVDAPWAAYLAAPRIGDVVPYRDTQLAEAKRLGFKPGCLVFGMNIPFGGDGSSGIEAPRSLRTAYQMSGAEIERYARVLLPHTPFFVWYKYDPALESQPEIRAALVKVRAMADTLPRPTCKAG